MGFSKLRPAWAAPFALAFALGQGMAQTPGIASGSVYTFTSKATGKLLDVANASVANGGAIDTWVDTKSDAQRWLVTSAGGNLYTLTNAGSGRMLHLATAVPAAAVKLNQNANTNDNTVKWTLVDAGGGAYQLQPAASAGFSLEALADTGTSAIPGPGAVQLGASGASDAQKWTLQVQQPTSPAPTAQAADELFAAWKAKNYLPGANGANVRNEGFWVTAEIMEIVVDAYEVTGLAKYRDMFADMYKGFIAKNGKDWTRSYNDDIAWIVLACLRAGLLTGNAAYTAQGKSQFDMMFARAWTPTYGGGLLWNQQNTTKNACINGPAMVAAMYLEQATGDTSYFNKAVQVYEWSKLYLFVKSSGKVNDNYDGRISSGSTTYNQGTYLGAAVMLYDRTLDTAYLNDANKIAAYTRTSMYRDGVMNGEQGPDLDGFKGIFMRYARRYIVDLNKPDYIPWLQLNAKVAYNNRNASNIVTTLWGTRARDTAVDAFSASTAVSLLINCPLGTKVTKDPYAGLEAERYDYMKGITVTPTTDAAGTDQIGEIADGYYTGYMNVDFGAKGSKSAEFRVAAAAAGGSIEIRVRGIAGPLMGTAAVPATGGAAAFATVTATLKDIGGMQNIYLVYRGPANTLAVNSFKFIQDGDGTGVRAASRGQAADIRLNPSGTHLLIDLGGAFAGTLSLADMRGRILYRHAETAPGRYALDVSAYPKGVYYFAAESGRGAISKKVVLK